MMGKSLQEMEAKLGPSRPQGICRSWDLSEGQLIVCYSEYTKKMKRLEYQFPPAPLFRPRTAVSSPEEMAALVKIDLQGREPDTEFQGGYAYNDLILNGKAVDVDFDGGAKNNCRCASGPQNVDGTFTDGGELTHSYSGGEVKMTKQGDHRNDPPRRL
jgi:hypothetical protein